MQTVYETNPRASSKWELDSVFENLNNEFSTGKREINPARLNPLKNFESSKQPAPQRTGPVVIAEKEIVDPLACLDQHVK